MMENHKKEDDQASQVTRVQHQVDPGRLFVMHSVNKIHPIH